ncbi:hypothetical protein EX87_07115 [Brevibacillus laterosporus]|uniref:Uncharacterized protein n=1 Tax=Brevibacillus laterosporus TaxID=1465 RepID=A0A0F6XZA3_BRELA|nr:hypothetical protein EX87_07115 [Brevibacillus laterosporus]
MHGIQKSIKKVTDIQGSLTSFEQEYVKNKGSMQIIQKLDGKFYQKHNAWVTPLNSMGNYTGEVASQKVITLLDHFLFSQTKKVPLFIGAPRNISEKIFMRFNRL